MRLIVAGLVLLCMGVAWLGPSTSHKTWQSGKDVKQVIAELTPVLRGWGNYFRAGNADREFNRIDTYVVRKLRRWQRRRGGQRPTKRPSFTNQQLYGMGLHRLRGTVCYRRKPHPEDHR